MGLLRCSLEGPFFLTSYRLIREQFLLGGLTLTPSLCGFLHFYVALNHLLHPQEFCLITDGATSTTLHFYPLIKALRAMGPNRSSTSSISSLNLLRYAHVDSFSLWVTLNSYVKLFFMGMLVLKHETSLTHKSWKLRIDTCSRLLYHVS